MYPGSPNLCTQSFSNFPIFHVLHTQPVKASQHQIALLTPNHPHCKFRTSSFPTNCDFACKASTSSEDHLVRYSAMAGRGVQILDMRHSHIMWTYYVDVCLGDGTNKHFIQACPLRTPSYTSSYSYTSFNLTFLQSNLAASQTRCSGSTYRMHIIAVAASEAILSTMGIQFSLSSLSNTKINGSFGYSNGFRHLFLTAVCTRELTLTAGFKGVSRLTGSRR